MRINVGEHPAFNHACVGNVYPISGGYGRRAGHLMVLLAITKAQMCLMLVIDKEGGPVGVTAYGQHAIEDRAAVAFVPGLDELVFNLEPIL